MRIRWVEHKIPNDIELDWYPDADWSLMDRHYEGEVIGVSKSFWGTTYLSVACDDGKIRECKQAEAKIIKNE